MESFTLKINHEEDSDTSSSDDDTLIHEEKSCSPEDFNTSDEDSTATQKKSHQHIEMVATKRTPDNYFISTLVQTQFDHHFNLVKEKRSYIFRKIITVQSGLSLYFTSSILTQMVFDYFKMSGPATYISPVVGSLFGTLSAVSSFLGTGDFIHSRKSIEKEKLLNEIKEMEKEINEINTLLEKYESKRQSKQHLKQKKKQLEEEMHTNRRSIKDLWSTRSNIKTISTMVQEEKDEKEKKEEKHNATEDKPEVHSNKKIEKLGFIQAALSGYFTGSTVTQNILGLGSIVCIPASITTGLTMSALFGISTFYAMKERRRQIESFKLDKMEIQQAQQCVREKLASTATKMKEVRERELLPKLNFKLQVRCNSSPAITTPTSLNSFEKTPTTLHEIKSFESPFFSDIKLNKDSCNDIKMSSTTPLTSPFSETKSFASPSISNPTSKDFFLDDTKASMTSLISTVSDPKTFESTPATDKILSSKHFFPDALSVTSNDNKLSSDGDTLSPNESQLMKLRNKWSDFKTRNLIFFRGFAISKALVSGFVTGYSMSAELLKACQVSKHIAIFPNSFVGLSTMSLFTFFAHKDLGEFIISKELFGTEKRGLKAEQEKMQKKLKNFRLVLEKSDQRIEKKIEQLEKQIVTLEKITQKNTEEATLTKEVTPKKTHHCRFFKNDSTFKNYPRQISLPSLNGSS